MAEAAACEHSSTYPEYRILDRLVRVELAIHKGDHMEAARDLEQVADQMESFGLLFLYPGYLDLCGWLAIGRQDAHTALEYGCQVTGITISAQQAEYAATELAVERGFEASGLREIAARAEVSPGMIAYYFGDRSGLHEAIFERAFDEERFSLVYQPIVRLQGEPFELYEVFLRLVDDVSLDKGFANFKGRCSDNRRAAKRRGVGTESKCRGHRFSGQHGPNGQSVRQCFCQCHNIRFNSKMFVGKQFARTPHSSLNLIKYQQDTIFITNPANRLQIIGIWTTHPALTLYRFNQHRTMLRSYLRTESIGIVKGDKVKTFKNRGKSLFYFFLTGSRKCRHGSPVK